MTLTAKELAQELNTDPRTVRKFLRHRTKAAGGVIGEDTPGKGGRYGIEKRQVKTLRKEFTAWVAAKTPAPAEDASDEA